MTIRLADPELEALRDQRQAWGADKYDEVWEGEYFFAPPRDNEHQAIIGDLCSVFLMALDKDWNEDRAKVRPGVNVSDREDWEFNFRCPEVVVFLNDTKAQCRDIYWLGGPDFAVEIVSPDDRTLDKLPFYAKVKTRELLIVDRDPWQLELMRLKGDELVSAGISTVENKETLASNVLPFTFRLVAGDERPRIEVTHTEEEQTWLV